MSTNHKRWKDMLVGGVITVAAVALVGTAVAAIGPKINNISAAPTSTGSGSSTLSAGASTASTSYIGEERAKEIALNHAGLTASGVTFVRSHLDWDDGRAQYEVEFYANNTEYDYDIDATTGDIRSYDYDAEYYTPPATSQSGDTISESQVKEIVQSRSGTYDGTFSRINLDWDDGRMVYEGEYYSGWTEYEFEIDAYSGTILGWDWD